MDNTYLFEVCTDTMNLIFGTVCTHSIEHLNVWDSLHLHCLGLNEVIHTFVVNHADTGLSNKLLLQHAVPPELEAQAGGFGPQKSKASCFS